MRKKLRGGGSEPCGYVRKGCSGRRYNKYKGPEVGLCLESSRNSEETAAECVGRSSRKGGQEDVEGRRSKGTRLCRTWQAVVKILAFMGSL